MTDPSLPQAESATLKLLGGAIVQSGDTPLGGAAAHRHRLALLALLSVHARPMSRDKLIALLWPERDTESARNLLKVALHELRKVLGDDVLRATGDQLSVDTSILRNDVADFEAALAATDFEKAAQIYAGPFLDGFVLKGATAFERWADEERLRLANAYAGVLDELASAADARGDTQSALHWWRLRSAHEPLRSDVALRLMRALAAAGDRVAAIQHAELHTTLRRSEINVEPNPAVAQLARELATQSYSARTPAADEPLSGADRAPGTGTSRRSLAQRLRDLLGLGGR